MHRFAALLLVITMALPSAAAMPIPPNDDNGHQSFVRQIVPKLLGRRPKGTLEVQLLADLAELVGREQVVRTLMEEPEFVDHWTTVLIDQLKVDREGGLAQAESCYGGPMPFGEAAPGPISPQSTAEFVRSENIQSNYHRAFNMFELIQSAIHDDHVFPIYRAHLFALGHKVGPPNGMVSAEERRAIVGSTFDDVFLNRDFECMACHNSQAAVTDYDGRHHPNYRGLDSALFAGESPPPSNVESDLYQTTCATCHSATGVGIPGAGGGPYIRDKTAQDIADAISVAGSTMSGFAGVLDLAERLALEEALAYGGPFSSNEIATTASRHFAMFRRDFFRPLRYCEDNTTICTNNDTCEGIGTGACQTEEVGWGPWGISTDCAAIWNENNEGDIPAFFAGLSTQTGTVADIDDALRAGYQALPGAPDITGDTAFAYMVAAKISENVWQELMGSPLTLVNRYARNADQNETHKYLTEDVFIEHDWSLKELIVGVLGTAYFNRTTPRDSDAIRAYALAPLWDPFVPATDTCSARREERTIGDYVFRGETDTAGQTSPLSHGALDLSSNERCAFNGQGDLVHRYSPRTLMSASASALDWPAPEIFPGDQDDAERNFQRSIGQYLSSTDPGTRNVDFQALLYWDDAYGHCGGSGSPTDQDGTSDWVDSLLAAIEEENAGSPSDPVRLGDAVLTLKDWILQEPMIGGSTCGGDLVAADDFVFGEAPPPDLSPTEAQALESLFDQSLDAPIEPNAMFEFRARELCGAYLRSPQFMLAGIVRPDDFQTPRVRACNGGPCGYVEMCREYVDTLEGMGFDLECTTTGVREPLDLTFGFGGDPPPDDGFDLAGNGRVGERDDDEICRTVPEPGFGVGLLLSVTCLLGPARRRRARGRSRS